ncbi:transcription initiation factor IIB [Natrialbaceae archaeon A-CW2]|uniref:transcription initiation factor IIB n=1 Tax=Natronosalvus amylolyticus TaxID=2961994 RepID=UPI0020CA2184|nr:TFIIB-type zinc ribbon-containing protein [Natronosalvus amylolyticus]
MSTAISNANTQESGETCPECGGSVVRTPNEQVCGNCHVVTNDTPIDHGPEWRAFNHNESRKRARTGPPVTLGDGDHDLATTMSSSGRDSNGAPLSPTQRQRYARLRRLNRWFVESGNAGRSLRDGVIQLQKLASDLDVPTSVQSRAQTLFKNAASDGYLTNYGIDRTVPAVLYGACKLEGVRLPIDMVTVVAHASRREILQTYRFLRRELGLEVPPTEAADAVPAICSELDVSHTVEREAKAVIGAFQQENPGSGTFPSTVAATAVYAVCRHLESLPTVSQSEVGKAAGVNPCTISTWHSEVEVYVVE